MLILRGVTVLLTFAGSQVFLFPWLYSNKDSTWWLQKVHSCMKAKVDELEDEKV